MNEAVNLSAEYFPVAGSAFCAVPVFPATRKPGTAASTAVPPSSVTAVSISVTRCARLRRDRLAPDVRDPLAQDSPAPVGDRRTRIGSSKRPPFAIDANAVASWTVVTLIPCPNEAFAVSTSNHGRPCGRSTPAASPGSGTPVGSPKPNRRNAAYSPGSPSARPIFSAPMFELFARICVGVSQSLTCVS